MPPAESTLSAPRATYFRGLLLTAYSLAHRPPFLAPFSYASPGPLPSRFLHSPLHARRKVSLPVLLAGLTGQGLHLQDDASVFPKVSASSFPTDQPFLVALTPRPVVG